MAIEIEKIATNRYAPQGADTIALYTNGEGKHLTIGQLAISVCLRSAAVYESQSVLKMNMMSSGSLMLDTASDWMEKIANGTADWSEAKAYLTGTLGIDASTLPDAIDSYTKRMNAVDALKAKIDALVQVQQRDMIDLQTLVNRRDVAYSTSSNVVNAMGSSQNANAVNF